MCIGGATRNDKHLWKGFWSIEVLNKYKNLIWRACRNSLPTKGNLVRRIIITDPIGDRCAADVKDPFHALQSCSGLNGVWGDGELWGFRSGENFTEFKSLVKWILRSCKAPELFFILIWSIWKQRNQIRLNQVSCPRTSLHRLPKTDGRSINQLDPCQTHKGRSRKQYGFHLQWMSIKLTFTLLFFLKLKVRYRRGDL